MDNRDVYNGRLSVQCEHVCMYEKMWTFQNQNQEFSRAVTVMLHYECFLFNDAL